MEHYKGKVGGHMSPIQHAFQLCSYLLSYPNKDFIDSLEEVAEEIELLSTPEIEHELDQFIQKALNLTVNELITTYISTFDFGKKTNLYITYLSNGEQRERGMDLLFLKNYYQLHGFAVTDKELPDYLPVILEFSSQVDLDIAKPVLERYLANIKELSQHFDGEENLYGHILRAIMLALEGAGVTKTVRRSEEICSTSFYG